MAWYAYCISEKQSFPELLRHRKPIPLESVAGIQGNQVFLYPASDLAVVVSEHPPSSDMDLLGQANQRAAMDHARVIAECFKSSTVLPFRFGTVFADDDALRRSIRSNQRQFITNIERLRGKAEMHLKVTLDDCCREQIRHAVIPDAGVVGREYLSNLRENAALQRERQTKARAISVQMHRMFSPLAEEITCKRTETGKMLLDIAHLIDHKCVERYQNKYSSASIALKDCRMQLSGPWPPYHFVHHLTKGHSTTQHAHPAMA